MTVEIPLTQGQVARVCDCHAHLVAPYKWHAHKENKGRMFYAVRAATIKEKLLGAHKKISMHAIVNGTPPGVETDHINGNSLDNRCSNLRNATTPENQRNRGKQINNTSGYKGVSQKKGDEKWRAQIMLNGKQNHIGYFDTAESAARAYNNKAKELFGEFAKTDFSH